MDNVTIFEPKPDTCPTCGGELQFDIHDRKQHCLNCGRIFSKHIDFETQTVTIKEYGIADKTDNWNEMSEEEQRDYLNISRLEWTIDRFLQQH